jgi:hypothetical protein
MTPVRTNGVRALPAIAPFARLLAAKRKPFKKEVNMKSKYASVLSAAAVVLSVFCGTAHAAQQGCSAATLKGAYAFRAHGEVLGYIDSAGTLHAFTTTLILDDVSIFTFDGSGSFARTDFGNINGSPKNGQTAFNPNQSGTYTLNSDCTGSMTLTYTGQNITLGLEMVVGDDGTLVYAIISTEVVPSIPKTADGTTCTSGTCAEGVQVYLEGKKVTINGFR